LKLANLLLKLGNQCVSFTQLSFKLSDSLVTRIRLYGI